METFYLASYKNDIHPVAISNMKELVKEYMEVHRGLKPNEYKIDEGKFILGELQLEYPYAIIEQYEDWYLPSIDIEMILLNKDKIEDIVQDTVEYLKTILIFTQDIKKIPESDRNTIIKAMQIINSFKDKKKIWNKMVDNYKLSDLIFLDMETYWKKRSIYMDMRETRKRWDFMIEEKGDDKEEE